MVIKYFAFCSISIIYFVLICDANSRKYHGKNQIYYFENDKFQSDSCRAPAHKSKLATNMKQQKCAPIDTIVHLHINGQNININPERVVVKRCCETGCHGQNSCIAKKTREIPIAVNLINQYQKQQCGWLNVTEHTECTCKCLIDKSKCLKEKKIYNDYYCTCRCENEMMRKVECHMQSNMVWDEDTCSCRCTKEIMECTTGSAWVPKDCACKKLMM